MKFVTRYVNPFFFTIYAPFLNVEYSLRDACHSSLVAFLLSHFREHDRPFAHSFSNAN